MVVRFPDERDDGKLSTSDSVRLASQASKRPLVRDDLDKQLSHSLFLGTARDRCR